MKEGEEGGRRLHHTADVEHEVLGRKVVDPGVRPPSVAEVRAEGGELPELSEDMEALEEGAHVHSDLTEVDEARGSSAAAHGGEREPRDASRLLPVHLRRLRVAVGQLQGLVL